MDRQWLIDGRGLARMVKNAGLNSNVSHGLPCLPTGIKFDPSDIELLNHLAAKCGIGNVKPELLIDEFIPTLESDNGICYAHPENLPGAKKDGSSIHFFYRIANAYSTGQRKRRRIQDPKAAHVRWHKTGKTKMVVENGVLKGFKKIMVLYATSARGSKPGKCNWIMHQFHLGADEDEKEGEFVVSKIFYQIKENESNVSSLEIEDRDCVVTTTTQVIDPKTPKTNTPPPPVYASDDYHLLQSPLPETNYFKEASLSSKLQDEALAGEFEHVDDDDDLGTKLEGLSEMCTNKMMDSCLDLKSSTAAADVYGIGDLDNLDLDSPPDFQLSDLQFASQDSLFD
ncbi:SUPPRESSOR OF GAMMA RESPONSE 1-like [Andrographis paniculata]|uniref:SUPPRESSOR OF GAMMA RESPONSE 1-like n=1 Tax=Andrographis paniculata TaxID=175694 RepID=UPI0021E943A5|nr:SUPPRESSOR OF GAMMA RESPONSE 1-like [Andrographis paniculata]